MVNPDGDWSNYACYGYTIKSMESAGMTPEQIKSVIAEMRYFFDTWQVEKAAEYYRQSPY